MWEILKLLHMWRNFKFLQNTDFFAIYAILSQICFVVIYALLRRENFAQNFICGDKKTNIRYRC